MNSDLKLVKLPTATLKQLSKPVTKFDEALKKLASQMGQAMFDFQGIGLAAPQIGHNVRLIVVIQGEDGYQAYVNPEITFLSKEGVTSEEGCLSAPGIYGLVPRAKKIRFSYHDLDGKKHKDKAKGLPAIILQHECDHLQVRLIVYKIEQITHGQDELTKITKSSL